MCGFVGMVFSDSSQLASEQCLRAAAHTLEHRGPDEAGDWIKPGVALAHQRLKILDLTHGQQPMVNERYALVYNGEVYNFQELKPTYEQRGLTFDTRCDTEVVFKAIASDGQDAVDQFNGMFAIAHWDNVERNLLLVRDRLGQKPLYWYADENCLAFASELKALLVLLDKQFELDPVALDQFFHRGYILSPRTIFKNIHKLPAGCRLSLDAKQWKWAVESYWDVQPQEVPASDDDVLDQLDELLNDAVRMRLISDVPIGCLLSGGIDSTLITAMASRATGQSIEAFSMGFDGHAGFSELKYAEMVANAHGCKWHHRKVVTDDFPTVLDEVTKYFDEPFANFAMFPMRRLAQLAREELTVVLSGQGGDELSAGYAGRYGWALESPPQGVRFTSMDDLAMHLHHSSLIGWNKQRETLFSGKYKQFIESQTSAVEGIGGFWRRHAQFDRLNNTLYTDVRTNLPDYLVCVEERMTMSTSLEARNPMLDWRVVNFMLSLPASLKVRGKQFKWLLLELARRYGPIEAVDRPKQGFTPPIRDWIVGSGEHLSGLFEQTDGDTQALYSNEWRQYLKAGQYETQFVMPVYFSAMLAKWMQNFGKYMKPVDVEQFFDSSAARSTTNWHRSLRGTDALLLAQGRLFRTLLDQMPKDEPVLIVGDDDGWYSRLAQQEGFQPVRHVAQNTWQEAVVTDRTDTQPVETFNATTASARPYKAAVAVGVQAMQSLLSMDGLASDARILMLLPFATQQAQEIQTLINTLGQRLHVKGHQAVQFDQANAALILDCALPPAEVRRSA